MPPQLVVGSDCKQMWGLSPLITNTLSFGMGFQWLPMAMCHQVEEQPLTAWMAAHVIPTLQRVQSIEMVKKKKAM